MSELKHRLTYTANNVPLEQVIDSLRAQHRLLFEAIDFLSKSTPGAELKLVRVQVNTIQSGSLIIDLLLEIYGIYQKQIDENVAPGVESLIGVDVPKEYESLVTLALIGLTYYVSRMIYDAVRKKKGEPNFPAVHIEGNYNQVINILADKLVISTEKVDKTFASLVHPSKFRQLVKPVADFMRPAKSQPGSSIIGGGSEVPPEAVAEFPSDADIGQLAFTEIVDVPDALIEIRALDRDRSNTGWAAKILSRPDFQDRRLPMDLYPTVDAAELAKHSQVRADLVVEMIRKNSGDLAPKRLHLLTFRVP